MMRISSNEHDAGYKNFLVAREHGKKAIVLLDGKEVKDCCLADEECGFVERAVLDADGLIQIDPIDNNKIWLERVTGKVEVRFE